MQDISRDLVKIIQEEKCSSLLAFIEVKNGVHLQESKPSEESRRRLRDTRNINSNR